MDPTNHLFPKTFNFFFSYLTHQDSSSLQCCSKDLNYYTRQEKVKTAIKLAFNTLLNLKFQVDEIQSNKEIEWCFTGTNLKKIIKQTLCKLDVPIDSFSRNYSEIYIKEYFLNNSQLTVLKTASFYYLEMNQSNHAVILFAKFLKLSSNVLEKKCKKIIINNFFSCFCEKKDRLFFSIELFLKILITEKKCLLAFKLAKAYSLTLGIRQVAHIVINHLLLHHFTKEALQFVLGNYPFNSLENLQKIVQHYLDRKTIDAALSFVKQTKGKTVLHQRKVINPHDHLLAQIILHRLNNGAASVSLDIIQLIEDQKLVKDLLTQIILFYIKIDEFKQAEYLISLFNCKKTETEIKKKIQQVMIGLFFKKTGMWQELNANVLIENDKIRLDNFKNMIQTCLKTTPFDLQAFCLFATNDKTFPISLETMIYVFFINTYLKNSQAIKALDLASLIQDEEHQSEQYFIIINKCCQNLLKQPSITKIEHAIIKIKNPHLRRSIIHEFYSSEMNHAFEIKNFFVAVNYLLQIGEKELDGSLYHILYSCFALKRKDFDLEEQKIFIGKILNHLHSQDYQMAAQNLVNIYLNFNEMGYKKLMKQADDLNDKFKEKHFGLILQGIISKK